MTSFLSADTFPSLQWSQHREFSRTPKYNYGDSIQLGKATSTLSHVDPSPKSTHRPKHQHNSHFSHLCTSHHRTSRPFTLCAKLRAASTDSRLSFCRVFPKAQLRTSRRHPLRIANKDLLKEIAIPLRLHSNSLTGFPISQSLIDQSAPHFIATSSWFSVTRDVLPTTLGIRRENNRVIANAYSFACDLSKEEKLD